MSEIPLYYGIVTIKYFTSYLLVITSISSNTANRKEPAFEKTAQNRLLFDVNNYLIILHSLKIINM